jgi:hypothetical protein
MVRSAAQRFRRCAVALRRGDSHPEKVGHSRQARGIALIHASGSREHGRRMSAIGATVEEICSCCPHPSVTANRALHDAPEQGTVATPSARTTLEITTISVGDRDQHSIAKLCGLCIAVRMDAVGSTRPGRRMLGHDRQPAIRLDAVHQSDRREVPLGQGGNSGDLHDPHRDGNLGGADRGLLDRSFRPEGHRVRQRSAGRGRVDHQVLRRLVDPVLPGCRHRGLGRRTDLRGNCRQCAEMVSRPAWPRHGPDSRRLRRGLGADGCAARRRDPVERL